MNRKLFFSTMVFVLLAGLLLITGVHLPASASFAAESPFVDDAQQEEAYWDEFFANEMDVFGVHGAEMVMVQENDIRLIKGYGEADAAQKTPMDPKTTILRSGSIAKTLTALAINQLGDQGRLDLDADINRYLTHFKVPDTFPEPVTARQLINMTAGFDTRAIGIRASSRDAVIPLEEYLARRMPPRVLPPGRYRRYNDHELALAGYLVEVVSGMPYEQYVREAIFEPLEMRDSSILLPDDQLSRVARGYPVGAGSEEAYPLSYYYLNTAPGAGFNTTAMDMAHYLMVYLDSGEYTRQDGSQVRLLSAGAARTMLQTAFSYDPRLPGSANSFDERIFQGQRYLRKLGGAPGMQNNLILLPEKGIGFYLFTNTDGTGLRSRWEQAVAERYLSDPVSSEIRTDTGKITTKEAASFAGIYQEVSDYTSDTTIVQVQALVNPDLHVRVQANPDGSLQVWGRKYTAVAPTVFQDPLSGNAIAFERQGEAQADYLFLARTPYRRINWVETPTVQLTLLGFAVLVFLSGAARSVLQLLRHGPYPRNPVQYLAGLVSSLSLVFLAALLVLLLPVATGGDIWQFSFEPSPALRLVLAMPILVAGLAILLLVDTWNAWRRNRCSLLTRLHHTFVLFGVGAFIFFLHTWNLFGWRF